MTNFLMSMLFCMFLAQSANVPRPADITVRLVYLNSEKPAGGQQIILYEGKPSLASTIRHTQTTGSDGTARFRVSNPISKRVWVDDNNGKIKNCAWEDQLPLSTILSEGVTIGRDNRFGSSCKGRQNTITRLSAKPGEIVIFVRKTGSWDNLRHY